MLRPGHVIALCVLALLLIGAVMVNSAIMSVDPAKAVTLRTILLSKSTVYMVMALAALFACSRLPLDELMGGGARRGPAPGPGDRVAVLGIGVGVMIAVLLTVYLPFIGKEVYGSARWVRVPFPVIGEFSLQPSELAKWGMVPLVAWYAWASGDGLRRFWTGLFPALVAVGVVVLVVLKEDLGTGALIGVVAVIVLVAAGARLWHVAALSPLAAIALVAAVLAMPYRVRRLVTFLDPFAEPRGDGYHMIQSMGAVAGGGVSGRGLGHGLQKFGFLPEDHSDFLFAVICEELGLAGAVIVVVLYLAILWAGLEIIRRERLPAMRLVALGTLATVGLQAVINLAVVTGMAPTKGIALPLLSAGGTGWILTAGMLGLLVGMDRRHAWEVGRRTGVTVLSTPPARADVPGGLGVRVGAGVGSVLGGLAGLRLSSVRGAGPRAGA